MNNFNKELNALVSKYKNSLNDHLKLTSGEGQKIIDKDLEKFNNEFNSFISNDADYMHGFVGSNLELLKTHLSNKFKSLDDDQRKSYIIFLKETLQDEANQFVNATQTKHFLKEADLFYYVKGLNAENESLIKSNAKEKHHYLKELISLSSTSISINPESSTNNDINFKHWNEPCYNLFNYLHENYYDGKKRQLSNMWFFLRKHLEEEKYYFKMTKDNYKEYIQSTYKVELTNFGKSVYKFDDEMMMLDTLKKQFEKA